MAYTTIDDPSAHFQIALWTGSASTDTITFDGNSDLQLDLLWSKCRSTGHSHALMDTSRITSGDYLPLFTDTTDQEQTVYDSELQSITSDGFTVGTQPHAGGDGKTYVGYGWKANGGTTTTNDASSTGVGTIDSVYQANTTAGFSIVTHTGSGSAGNIAHGLGAVPDWIVTKNRTDNGQSWANYHVSVGNGYYLELDTTDAQESASSVWGDTTPSSTTFRVGGANGKNNASSKNYVSYCFTPIQGYSRFGKYVGNGAEPGGPFVYLGFKPAWLMITAYSESGQAWFLGDSKRDPTNEVTKRVFPNLDSAEGEASGDNNLDYLSNGFRITTQDDGLNKSGVSYVYFAFAESPFVSSEGVPTTAR